jgi:hypothetical protein
MASKLNPNEKLKVNELLISANRLFELRLQSDGNLVLYFLGVGTSGPIWASNTAGNPVLDANMQDDGNFVLYKTNGTPIWASNTAGNPGATVVVQDDGNVVVYNSNGTPLWATHTRPPDVIH